MFGGGDVLKDVVGLDGEEVEEVVGVVELVVRGF